MAEQEMGTNFGNIMLTDIIKEIDSNNKNRDILSFNIKDFDTEIKFMAVVSSRILKLVEFEVPAGYHALDFDIEISVKNSIGRTKVTYAAEEAPTTVPNITDLGNSRKEIGVFMTVKISKPEHITETSLDMIIRYRLE
jgi:hypothetical protein